MTHLLVDHRLPAASFVWEWSWAKMAGYHDALHDDVIDVEGVVNHPDGNSVRTAKGCEDV